MEKVSIYDPSVRAFREVSVEDAKKFIQSAKEAEEKIKASTPAIKVKKEK
jgi:hypothetical protein